MREPDRLAERPSGMARRARLLFASALIALAACGDAADPDASNAVTTTGDVVAPAVSPAATPEPTEVGIDSGVTPLIRCDEVPVITTQVVTTLDRSRRQAVLDAVLSIWEPEGPASEFGGMWADRETSGTLVVAVTDDPARHREAIAALLGGSTEGFDVIEVQFSERQLIDATGAAFEAARDDGLDVAGAAFDVVRNRVRLEFLMPISDDEFERLGAALIDAGVEPLEMVCVEAPRPEDMPPVIRPGTELVLDVAADGRWPGATIVSCHGMTFPLATLGDLVPFTQADEELATAARPHLGGENWAPELWRYASFGTDDAILFGITTGVSIHTFVRGANGWIWTDGVSGGICDLEATLPDGLNVVDWELDPDAPTPGVDATELAVLAAERACASGEPAGDRLLGPHVVETDTAVLITFAAIPQLSDQSCPSHPPTPVVVQLDAPLGDRTIRDGLLVGPITDLVEPLG